MRKLLLVFIFWLPFCTLDAQEANVWYFGQKAGLNFNTSPPSILTDGQMEAREGSSTICDGDGNLLFYSNGLTVYNRNHAVMANGDGLMGNASTLQACLIARMPGNDSIFYLFTADAFENDYQRGYRYSIINIKRNNGLGEVISKNILFASSGSERLTMARHRNGVDVWIITNDNNSNVFRAFLLDCTGFRETSPVVSAAGVVMNFDRFLNVGMMKVSPDGAQLCQTNYMADQTPFFQLFDFDNQTGVISGGHHISVPGIHYLACEFSPNSSFLYMVSSLNDRVDQFEARAGNSGAIVASRISLAATWSISGIQLAPDGKIYLCNATALLSVINFPDRKGPGCDLQTGAISLSPTIALLQLPAFMNDINFDPYNNFTTDVIDTCAGIVQFTGVTALLPPLQWHWDFGDGTTASGQNPLHQFNPADREYTVTLSVTSGPACSRSFKVRRQVSPRGVPDKMAFSIVERCDSGYIRLVNNSEGTNIAGNVFTWDFGDGSFSQDPNPMHTYTASGTYRIKLKRSGLLPCLDDSTWMDYTHKIFSLTISPDQIILAGQPVQLYARSSERASFKWTPANTLANADIFNPVALPLENTYYKVTATNLAGCIAHDSVFIQVRPVENIFVPTAFTPNGDRLNDEIRPFFPLNMKLSEFSIYNRWGQRVFYANMRGQGWDGKLGGIYQQAGVYVWRFSAVDETGKPVTRKGTLVLIR